MLVLQLLFLQIQEVLGRRRVPKVLLQEQAKQQILQLHENGRHRLMVCAFKLIKYIGVSHDPGISSSCSSGSGAVFHSAA